MTFDEFAAMMAISKTRRQRGYNKLVADWCGCSEEQVRVWKRRDAVPDVYVELVKMKVRVAKAIEL